WYQAFQASPHPQRTGRAGGRATSATSRGTTARVRLMRIRRSRGRFDHKTKSDVRLVDLRLGGAGGKSQAGSAFLAMFPRLCQENQREPHPFAASVILSFCLSRFVPWPSFSIHSLFFLLD